MTTADKLAKATVRIVSKDGVGQGSGFHFIKPEIIVSNAHVVPQLISGKEPMTASAESGEQWNLKLLAHSPDDKFDFAIMEASGPNFESRTALAPSLEKIEGRGREILFAGYPHGIDPLIVQSSEVIAPVKPHLNS
jgi:hypothetical protein